MKLRKLLMVEIIINPTITYCHVYGYRQLGKGTCTCRSFRILQSGCLLQYNFSFIRKKKIDTAIEVNKLMSYDEQVDAQIFPYKFDAKNKIIESLLLEDFDTNKEINKRITLALNFINEDSRYSNNKAIVIKTLCKANLHAKALKIIENLPSKKLFIGNYVPNKEKDEYFLMVAESLMNSISPGKGLVHKVYDHNKKHYSRKLNPPYCRYR